MGNLTLEDARELSGWQPPLGVVSVYLGYDPADRGGAWRTVLRGGVDKVLRPAAEDGSHERKVAVRETAKRLLARFEERGVRPLPRGEVGFVEVGRKEGREHWWETGTAPPVPTVLLADQPVVTQLVDLCGRSVESGLALLSAERVRLLCFGDGRLEAVEEWELDVDSEKWRERKAQSSSDPARAQGVSSSGHDQYDERLAHNRRRFLGDCGRQARERLRKRGLDEVILFGPAPEAEAFCAGLGTAPVRAERGGEADLISAPTEQLIEAVSAAVERLTAARDRACVERALEEALAGGRGAAGLRETMEALGEGRVESVVFDPAIGEPAEALVRGALSSGAEITVAHDGVAELLEPVEGVAALLRY
jgi:peptide subunit release factor 1 (eRF1)